MKFLKKNFLFIGVFILFAFSGSAQSPQAVLQKDLTIVCEANVGQQASFVIDISVLNTFSEKELKQLFDLLYSKGRWELISNNKLRVQLSKELFEYEGRDSKLIEAIYNRQAKIAKGTYQRLKNSRS